MADRSWKLWLDGSRDPYLNMAVDELLLNRIGGIGVSEKHANFLINENNAKFEDAVKLVRHVQKAIPQKLHVEMRFVGNNGNCIF